MDLHAPANAYRAASPALSHPQSRSASPKFNIADFENKIQPAHLIDSSSRETSYNSEAINVDDLDFARSSSNSPAPRRPTLNTGTSFLKRSASKLLPRAIATTNTNNISLLPTPPSSGPSSPTKTLSSFLTGNTSSSLSSSASKASVRARTASKVLFDNYFSGDSNNVLQPHHHTHNRHHARNYSVASVASIREEYDRYEQDHWDDGYDEREVSMSGYTRQPERTRPRRSPTMESTASTSYAGKLGSWFSKSSSPKAVTSPARTVESDDPLLSFDANAALFPHGPVDPLNPTSFNDLLAAAEAVISTYQNAYKARVAELEQMKAEVSIKEDELEECETRAAHLKSQLQDMGEQCLAERQKATAMEELLRERPATSASSEQDYAASETLVSEGSRRRHVHAGSDSGFESDGDSIFSHASPSGVKGTARQQAFTTSSPSRPQFSNDLRTENEMLRQRVVELEGAVDSCLDMISNPLAL